MGAALEFTQQNFQSEVLKSSGVVLVDFWAEWCGPCKMLAPIIDQLALELQGKVKIGKVDVDSNPELAGQYNVMSIPTLLVFKNGQAVDQMVGVMPKDKLLAKLQSHI